MEAEMLKRFLPDLVTAISDCVQPVSDQCLAKGLIPDSVYKRVLESGGTSEDKARTLILAVKTSTVTDSRCLKILLTILEEKLPFGIKDNLLSQIRKEITEKANTRREVVPLTHSVQLVSSEQLPRESTAIHTQLLGRLEDSIRQHERACTEKNLLEQKLKAKSEKYGKLKCELEALKSQNKDISASIRDNMDRAQSRISACESQIGHLKIRIKELEKTIEEQDMQAKRGRDTITTGIKSLFTSLVEHNQEHIKEMLEKAETETRQKAEEQMKIKEMQYKVEIHEKELRIRELQVEIKSKPQDDAYPPDVLNPASRLNLANFMKRHPSTYTSWRKLGAGLGFSNQELDEIDRQSTDATSEGKLNGLLKRWLHRYPGDIQGSTSFATYTQLKIALVNTGLGAVARDLPPYEELKHQHKHQ